MLGSKYDVNGDLRDWWSEASWNKYENRTVCLKNFYSEYKVQNLQVIFIIPPVNLTCINQSDNAYFLFINWPSIFIHGEHVSQREKCTPENIISI